MKKEEENKLKSLKVDISEKLMYVLDEYQKNNSFENREFLCYFTSAIYLTYKKLFPQLSIYIPFRTKSDDSCIRNIQKETQKYGTDIESDEPFDTFPIEKDMSGLKIILNDINFSLPSTPENDELFNDPEIKELMGYHYDDDDENDNEDDKKRYTRRKNFEFIHKVENYLNSPIKTGKEYVELKMELLERIKAITPDEFFEERFPEPSFDDLYWKTVNKHYYFSANGFPTTVSNSQISDLSDLLNDFRSRVDDKLHFAILRKTLPIVLNSPLIVNALQTSSTYDKEVKKDTGFQAIYYVSNTPFGPVELQAQSNRAYYTSTKGSAAHSNLLGKGIDIKDFFELVDPNDKHDLSFYLDALDSASADAMVSPYEIPELRTKQEKEEFLKTPLGIAFFESEKYRIMMKHIKFKEEIEIDGRKYNTTERLLSRALSASPYMNVCSSGHTSTTTAGIHHKKVIGEFAEVLRKKDSNTCLRDLVIRHLENIIENPPDVSDPIAATSIKHSLDLIKEHDEVATKLPKDVSMKNIISFSAKLHERKNSDLDLDLVI